MQRFASVAFASARDDEEEEVPSDTSEVVAIALAERTDTLVCGCIPYFLKAEERDHAQRHFILRSGFLGVSSSIKELGKKADSAGEDGKMVDSVYGKVIGKVQSEDPLRDEHLAKMADEEVLAKQAKHKETMYLSPNVRVEYHPKKAPLELSVVKYQWDNSSEESLRVDGLVMDIEIPEWYPHVGDVTATNMAMEFRSVEEAVEFKDAIEKQILHPNLSSKYYEDTRDKKIQFNRLNGLLWRMILTGDVYIRSFYFSISKRDYHIVEGETAEIKKTIMDMPDGGAPVFDRLVNSGRRLADAYLGDEFKDESNISRFEKEDMDGKEIDGKHVMLNSIYYTEVTSFLLYRISRDVFDRAILLIYDIEENKTSKQRLRDALPKFNDDYEESYRWMHKSLYDADRMDIRMPHLPLRAVHTLLYRRGKDSREDKLQHEIRKHILRLLSSPEDFEKNRLDLQSDEPKSFAEWKKVFKWYKSEVTEFRKGEHPFISFEEMKLMKASPFWLLHRVMLDTIAACDAHDHVNFFTVAEDDNGDQEEEEEVSVSRNSRRASRKKVKMGGTACFRCACCMWHKKKQISRYDSTAEALRSDEETIQREAIHQSELLPIRRHQLAKVIAEFSNEYFVTKFRAADVLGSTREDGTREDMFPTEDYHFVSFFFNIGFKERNELFYSLFESISMNNDFFRHILRHGLKQKNTHVLVETISAMLFGDPAIYEPCANGFKKSFVMRIREAPNIIIQELINAGIGSERRLMDDYYLLMSFALRFDGWAMRRDTNHIIKTLTMGNASSSLGWPGYNLALKKAKDQPGMFDAVTSLFTTGSTTFIDYLAKAFSDETYNDLDELFPEAGRNEDLIEKELEKRSPKKKASSLSSHSISLDDDDTEQDARERTKARDTKRLSFTQAIAGTVGSFLGMGNAAGGAGRDDDEEEEDDAEEEEEGAWGEVVPERYQPVKKKSTSMGVKFAEHDQYEEQKDSSSPRSIRSTSQNSPARYSPDEDVWLVYSSYKWCVRQGEDGIDLATAECARKEDVANNRCKWMILQDSGKYSRQDSIAVHFSTSNAGSVMLISGALGKHGSLINGPYRKTSTDGTFKKEGNWTATINKSRFSKEVIGDVLIGLLKVSLETRTDIFVKFVAAWREDFFKYVSTDRFRYDNTKTPMRTLLTDFVYSYFKCSESMKRMIDHDKDFFTEPEHFSYNALDCFSLAANSGVEEDMKMIARLIMIGLKFDAGVYDKEGKETGQEAYSGLRQKIAQTKEIFMGDADKGEFGALKRMLFDAITKKVSSLDAQFLKAKKDVTFDRVYTGCIDQAVAAYEYVKDLPHGKKCLEGLFLNYINNQDISAWEGQFTGSRTVAQFIKYSTREDLDQAFEKMLFEEGNRDGKNDDYDKFKKLLDNTRLLFGPEIEVEEPESKDNPHVMVVRRYLSPVITRQEIQDAIKPVEDAAREEEEGVVDGQGQAARQDAYDTLCDKVRRRMNALNFPESEDRPLAKQDTADAKFAYLLSLAWMDKFNEDGAKGCPEGQKPMKFPMGPRNVQLINFLMCARWLREVVEDTEFFRGVGAGADGNSPVVAAGGGGAAVFSPHGFRSYEDVLRTLVTKVGTGEGKSLVIAFTAAYSALELHKDALRNKERKKFKVHVLENNEGLLAKDFANFKTFFENLGLRLGKADSTTKNFDEVDSCDVVYLTLRAMQNLYKHSVGKSEFGDQTVLIVDEVDDLIVDTKPNDKFVMNDVVKSEMLKKSLEVLCSGSNERPEGVTSIAFWLTIKKEFKRACAKVKGVDYQIKSDKICALDKSNKEKPESFYALWLEIVRYKEGFLIGRYPQYGNPNFKSPYFFLSLPHMVRKYTAVLGLSGSLGTKSEKDFLKETYKAWSYDVPSFLDTCGETVVKQKPKLHNHEVVIVDNHEEQVARMFELAFTKMKYNRVLDEFGNVVKCNEGVPVTIICESAERAQDLTRRFRLMLDERINSLKQEVQAAFLGNNERKNDHCKVFVQYFGEFQCDLNMKDPEEGAKVPSHVYSETMKHSTKELTQDLISADAVIAMPELQEVVGGGELLGEKLKPRPMRIITITEPFGGRGHDFDVKDEQANNAGGMLVIVTTVPKPRDWVQWRGRTGRSDRKGQYSIILCRQDAPFTVRPFYNGNKPDAEMEVRRCGCVGICSVRYRLRKIATKFENDTEKELFEKQILEAKNGEKEINKCTHEDLFGRESPPEDPTPITPHILDVIETLHDRGAGDKIRLRKKEIAKGQRLNELSDQFHNGFKLDAAAAAAADDGSAKTAFTWPREQFKEKDIAFAEFLRFDKNTSTAIEDFKRQIGLVYSRNGKPCKSIYDVDERGEPPVFQKDPKAKRIMIALDYSGSMKGPKMDAARENLLKLLNDRIDNEDHVGLITFTHVTQEVFPLQIRGPNCDNPLSGEKGFQMMERKIKELVNPNSMTVFRQAMSEIFPRFTVGRGQYDDIIIALTDGGDTSNDFADALVYYPGFATTPGLRVYDPFITEPMLLDMVRDAASKDVKMAFMGIGDDLLKPQYHTLAPKLPDKNNPKIMVDNQFQPNANLDTRQPRIANPFPMPEIYLKEVARTANGPYIYVDVSGDGDSISKAISAAFDDIWLAVEPKDVEEDTLADD